MSCATSTSKAPLQVARHTHQHKHRSLSPLIVRGCINCAVAGVRVELVGPVTMRVKSGEELRGLNINRPNAGELASAEYWEGRILELCAP